MSYPSYLEYFSSSIENVSTATFKIQPTSNNAVSSHQQITFHLPQNTLLDFRKLRMQFQVTSSGSFTRLPPHASAYFNRISIEVGGQTVSAFENANVLDEILRNNLQIEVDPVNEHSTIQRKNNPFSATAISAAETYDTDDDKAFFSIDLGTFARSIQPSIVAMMMLPQVSIVLHLAENAVCASPSAITDLTTFKTAAASQGTYSIVNHNLFAECYDIQDGSLMAMYEQTMMDQGYLELTYENWTSFSDVFNSVTRFSSSAQSLNKIVATFRRGSDTNGPLVAAYNAPNGAIPVRGYNNELLACAAGTYGTATSDTKDDGAIAGVLGQPETNGTSFQSAFFVGSAPVLAASLDDGIPKGSTLEPMLNFSINSVKMPSYNCKASGWYDLTKSAWGVSRTKSNLLAEWYQHRYSICQRLDLPDSKQLRVMSGLNLKASNANLTLEVTGNHSAATTEDNVLVYLASSNIMRVGLGKQIQLLH
jgi:hypothetical protein